MAALAPALFRMITGCPSSAVRPSATSRAITSLVPPGGYGTTSSRVLLGNVCAPAVDAASKVAAKALQAVAKALRASRMDMECSW